jgi:hypothetical protein
LKKHTARSSAESKAYIATDSSERGIIRYGGGSPWTLPAGYQVRDGRIINIWDETELIIEAEVARKRAERAGLKVTKYSMAQRFFPELTPRQRYERYKNVVRHHLPTILQILGE